MGGNYDFSINILIWVIKGLINEVYLEVNEERNLKRWDIIIRGVVLGILWVWEDSWNYGSYFFFRVLL